MQILLRQLEEQDFNNLFKVKILLHPNVKQDCEYFFNKSAFHHLLFFTLILGPFFAAFFGS